MSAYVFVFAALLAAAVPYWLVHFRVRRMLQEAHPRTWRSLKIGFRVSLAATQWFALRRSDRGLNDKVLSRSCIALQILTIVVWLLMAAYAIALLGSVWLRR